MNAVHTQVSLTTLVDSSCITDRLIAAGMSGDEARAKRDLFAKSAKSLLEAGHDSLQSAIAVFVPGRIEILGKHTDYCGGRSLVCAVEKGMCFVAVPRTDPVIHFYAVDLAEEIAIALDRDGEPTKRHWSNYPMTVARRVARNFPAARTGVDVALSSDLPPASGLSSSSAMIVGTFMVLSIANQLPADELYRQNIHNCEDLAGYLGCVENGQSFRELAGDLGVGTFGGSQDHTAILCCKPGQLSTYSFCPVVHERDIAFPEDLCFVIAHSGVTAEKTGDALERYNQVSKRARQLVTMWNMRFDNTAGCLREVVKSQPDAVNQLRELLEKDNNTSLLTRLDQFLIESEVIIPQSADAFETEDWATLRTLVNASQTRAENDLQNQVDQTISLHRLLMRKGALAASAFGAGFGGSVWGLFRKRDLAHIDLPSHFVTRPGCAAIQLSTTRVRATEAIDA